MKHRFKAAPAAVLLASLVLTSACSTGTGADAAKVDGPKVSKVAKIADMIPGKFGKNLVFSVSPNYPPYYMQDSNQHLIGFMPDLAQAMSEVMGVSIKIVVNANIQGAIPAIQSGKYQGDLNGWTVTTERENTLDMVTMGNESFTFMRPKDSDPIGNQESGLCGKTIAVISSDATVQGLRKISSDVCEANGAKPIKLRLLPDQSACLLAVQSGRADATSQNTSNLGYQAKQSDGQLVVDGPQYLTHPLAILTQKGNGLADVYAAAIQHLIDDGVYQKLLNKYGMDAIAIKKAQVNPSVD